MEIDYRSVCNLATLQSDKRGFFLNFAELVESEAGPEWINKFEQLPSDKDRIEACLKDPQVCDIIHGMLSKVQKIFRGKAAKFALSKKDEGEHWLRKGKLDRSLASTNLAVVRAPVNDAGGNVEDLKIVSLSLWLRSEILYQMSEYELALNDIQLALKYHLPNDLKGEAYQRMGMCYLNIGDKKKSAVSLSIAQSCGNHTVQEECRQTLQEIDTLLKPMKEKKKSHSLPSHSTNLPGLTKSVTLSKTKNCGRFIKAALPITVGELIACEEPYVSALFIEKHGTHCLHCYKRLKAPIPCPNCSGVGFCSNECQKEGMKYHQWECPYLELHVGSGMSILSHLALRMVTQQSLDYFKKAKSEDHEYQQVLKLEGHFKKRDGKDLLRRTLMSLFLLQTLRHGGYFSKGRDEVITNSEKEEDAEDMLSEEELYIGCLILHHLQVLQYNAHEIYETVLSSQNEQSQGVTLYIALGLYLNSSLFNHQCQPTLARYFQGKKIILRAQRPINVGEEVTENYGPVFTMRSKDQRQNVLRGRYLFECNCDACLQDWPSLTNMSPDTALYRCKQKNCAGCVPVSGICRICGQQQPIKDDKILFYSFQDDWNKAIELMKTSNFTEAENLLLQYVKDMWALIKQPSKNICLAMEALRTIWANSSGNISILPIKPKNMFS